MNVLFVCNQNKHRSKTAEELFKKKFNTKSVGLYGGKLITQDHLTWANIVFVMEEEQRKEIARRYPNLYLQKKILSLDIPDTYYYNQPDLKELLKKQFNNLSIHQIVF
ncbi:phosphotyrosine protein phosphatase [Candidatus Woesearchaeota archaeon CG10_big_fil_rev_8_21_14_0_10_30_7]|nr:MAG: phosphotyrosine protein phosphatase [Candidatus Woesearchaeota archaeon CG10_big_fil_rev_8_21_14_0_10_30_7]